MEERDGWLGIHYAARWGDMSMLKSYVKAGANIDGKTNSKETALHKCGRWDRKEAALYLLGLGANPSFKNGDGNKASDMTADPEMKFLLENYQDYLALEEVRKREKEEKEQKDKANNHGLGLFQVSNRLYDSSLNSQLAINMDEIYKSSPYSKSKPHSSSNSSDNSKSSDTTPRLSSPRSPTSVTSNVNRK